MCSVKKDDVKQHVVIMKQSGNYNANSVVIQTSVKKVTTLENSTTMNDDIMKFVNKLKFSHRIDIENGRVHVAECEQGETGIKARLINLKSTGLNICECCK